MVKFYMEEVDYRDVPIPMTQKDLEVDFEGLRYIKADGINDIGKPRIYTESFAEEDGSRVYIPSEITNDSTQISLSLLFVGDNRQDVFDSFNEYIRHGRHSFWDTLRNKKFTFIMTSPIHPENDTFTDGSPYIRCTYKLTNLKGKTKKNIK